MMQPNLNIPVVVTPPATQPVTRDEAKLWLKVDTTADDNLIDELIDTATQIGEKYTRRSFVTQTLKLQMDCFPYRRAALDDRLGAGYYQIAVSEVMGGSYGDIYLQRGPVQSVTSVVCYDTGDSATTVATSVYGVDVVADRIYLKTAQSWPGNLRDTAAVEVTYTAGYGAASAVPSAIKSAIKMHVQSMYDGRIVCDLPRECMALLDAYSFKDRLAVYG